MNNTVYRKVNINKWLINNEKVLNILPNKNKNENNRLLPGFVGLERLKCLIMIRLSEKGEK